MRVLFTTVAQSTHLYNMVPLAWAMHTAGHEVRIVSSSQLADRIEATGLTALPVAAPMPTPRRLTSDAFTYAEPRPASLDWNYMLGKFAVFSGLMFPYYEPHQLREQIVRFARAWRPDLAVWDMFSFSGAAAAVASGAAHVRMLVGLDFMGQMRAMFLDLLRRQPEELRDDPLAELLTTPVPGTDLAFDEELVVGQYTVDPLPSALRLPVDLEYLPLRYVPYHGPASCPPWVHEPPRRPRVCLTLGLTAREGWDVSDLSVDEMFDAVADLDIEVVATFNAAQARSARRVPDNVRLVDFVPLQALLPSCSALIHHGGTGSFGTALAHGVPQLIVPHGYWDTTPKAMFLEERGAGLHLPVGGFSAAAMRDALIRIVGDPSFRTGAYAVQAENQARPSPNDLVPTLEKIAAERRR
ncbi:MULTISPECIES: activator-dependent family glycosyltransferase [Micromonospora]|uniref:activator-dependent family glycosyltransferase n=1 Tax=Micromonospora TaxID=1873 RepID=UPI0034054C11